MRRIDNIVLHCTATQLTTTVESIQRHWRTSLGWRNPGYHIVVRSDGTWQRLASDSAVTNGVAGHNANSLHIAYIGGQHTLDWTQEQQLTILAHIARWQRMYPKARILGHRDFPNVAKECPRVNTSDWLQKIGYI